jgi:hypothetical protein
MTGGPRLDAEGALHKGRVRGIKTVRNLSIWDGSRGSASALFGESILEPRISGKEDEGIRVSSSTANNGNMGATCPSPPFKSRSPEGEKRFFRTLKNFC